MDVLYILLQSHLKIIILKLLFLSIGGSNATPIQIVPELVILSSLSEQNISMYH